MYQLREEIIACIIKKALRIALDISLIKRQSENINTVKELIIIKNESPEQMH